MTVLVTGGGGLIGAKVSRRLRAAGETVAALDMTDDLPRLAGAPDIARIACDIRDRDGLIDCFRRYEVRRVVHLAALLAPVTETDPGLGFSVNIQGTANVFEAARQSGAERVVYVSSIAVYGDQSEYGAETRVDVSMAP